MIDIDVMEILIESSEDKEVIAEICIARALGLKAIGVGKSTNPNPFRHIPFTLFYSTVMELMRILKEHQLINPENTSTSIMRVIETGDLNFLHQGIQDWKHPELTLGIRPKNNEFRQRITTINTEKED